MNAVCCVQGVYPLICVAQVSTFLRVERWLTGPVRARKPQVVHVWVR